jgi:7,8-dihydropterin-6-yl-methyl-4-(beta-D-ribofuranosyl)aminobenzene 5'-phosphate synthase
MEKRIGRREFLQATAVAGTGLMAANLPPGASAAPAATKVQIPESEKITITMITDNLSDLGRLDYKIAKRPVPADSPLDIALHAEHGLAYHVETVVGGKAHSCLFDFASDPRGVMRNLDLLKIDLQKVEAFGMSHDHWDHQAAMVEVLKARKQAFGKSIPFYIGEQYFVGTYMKRQSGTILKVNLLKREELEGLGFVRIVETKGPTSIIPGAYFPGKIEQITDYEILQPQFLAKKGNDYIQETFPGEQALILNVKGKGLVVLSGCAHRGIVNAVKTAQKMTGIDKVHAVIGGCHLINQKPEVILKTVADIKAINPDYVVPTHCTGFEAISVFAREMPDEFILNTVGTKYIMSA